MTRLKLATLEEHSVLSSIPKPLTQEQRMLLKAWWSPDFMRTLMAVGDYVRIACNDPRVTSAQHMALMLQAELDLCHAKKQKWSFEAFITALCDRLEELDLKAP